MVLSLLVVIAGGRSAVAQLHPDEQRRITWHDESSVSRWSRSPGPAPVTVASEDAGEYATLITLDEAIGMALRYSEVIRVLAGDGAVSSGRTIYDPAIATTAIDGAVARFDPVFEANTGFVQRETPFGEAVAGPPAQGVISDIHRRNFDVGMDLRQTNRLGGTGSFGVTNDLDFADTRRGRPLLNRTNSPSLALSYTQPLLQGFGRDVNEAPIVIARLQLDQSYFQFKDAFQALVQGVITGYWQLVQARTELWAREKQLEQTLFTLQFNEAQLRVGRGDIGDVSQARVAYNNFRANLIAARGNVLQREAALRNVIGLPPEDGTRLVPSTPPTRERITFDWQQIIATAQIQRPDLIELNLVLMADQQRLVQASNTALPSLNANAVQRWNGLQGQLVNGSSLSSSPRRHTDWTLGVTFEVPLGLRQGRAALRSQELVIARDRANIQQRLHQIEHELATSLRTLDQNYLQYEAFRDTREAARTNLEVQFRRYRAGLGIGANVSPFLNVLQAITDWGNAVSSEAQTLTTYNSSLASLEQQTGTILQTHGITFREEQFGSIGPWGRHYDLECYPKSLMPDGNAPRYEDSELPAEEAFDLEDYPQRTDDPVDALRKP
jgi:outer membrane protein TolC